VNVPENDACGNLGSVPRAEILMVSTVAWSVISPVQERPRSATAGVSGAAAQNVNLPLKPPKPVTPFPRFMVTLSLLMILTVNAAFMLYDEPEPT
jgi:hypothetical protein